VKRTGKSERTVQRLVLRAARNASPNLKRVAGTALDRAAEFDALPLLPVADQERLIEQARASAMVSAVEFRKETSEQNAPSASAVGGFADDDLPGLTALKAAGREASSGAWAAFVA